MKEEMSKSQSLAIISEMIEAAKNDLKGEYFLLVFWGWLAIAIHLSHYYLLAYTQVPYSGAVWAITILGGIFTSIYTSRRSKRQKVTTHFDKAIGFTWLAYGLTVMVIIGAGSKVNYAIYPLITLITAFPTFLTGVLTRYKPLIFGGASFWIFAIVSFMVSPINQILVGAVALVFGYLVPGYLMKRQN